MNDKLDPEVQEKLGQLQMMERNMQNFQMQKQMFTSQLMEVESALDELKKSDTAFKIVGNIMVSSDKKELQKDLKEKYDLLKKRVDMFESQENKVREQAESLQAELLKAIK